MRPDRRSLLETHQMQLAQDLDISNVLPFLQASSVIPDGVVETINKYTGLKANLELLKAIKARGNDAFEALVEGLRFSKQDHLADLLQPRLYRENNENIEQIPFVPHRTPASLSRLSLKENDPTAWIDEEPMELTGLLDIRVEGTDGPTTSKDAREQWEMWQKNSNNIYPNFSSPKGLCLVINNYKFSDMPLRKGTEVDCKNVSTLFHQLGYKVLQHSDLTGKEMFSVLSEFAQNKSHGASLVVVVLTHGEDQVLMGTDGQTLNVNYVLSQFNSVHARHLTGKPKIFLFQACRGDRHDYGVASTEREEPDCCQTEPDAFKFNPFNLLSKSAKPQEQRLPVESDFFIAYSTVPNYVSWRNSLHGTWFIQSICEVFSRHARDMHIDELMILVNRRIAHGKATQEMKKQTPEFTSRLRKKFYFFPGVTQP